MNKRECAIVEAYTGYCMLTGDSRYILYKYLAELFGRPVFTHELASPKFAEEIKRRAKDDFVNLAKFSTDEEEQYD